MSWLSRNLYNLRNPQRQGSSTFYERVNGSPSFNSMQDNREKLEVVLRSPAVLSIFKLQCALFSLSKIGIKDNPEATSPLLDKLKQPNPFQGGRQFLWDYMFYLMMGNSYMEAGSKVINPENNIYWLNSANIEFGDKLLDKVDKHLFSSKAVKDLGKNTITYHYRDGSTRNIRLDSIETFADITNSTGNWYAGVSALDALYKVVSNSDAALGAKNINLDFAGKYIVGGDTSADNIYEPTLSKGEKDSIENMVRSGKKIHAVKSQISIARFVDNIAQLELDKSYFADYYIIGKMYGIPREVLEANLERGSTFDNQEVSISSYVEYVLTPKGEDLVEGLKNYFSLPEDLEISWNHLLFMQSVKKNEADVNKTRSETIKILTEAGVTIEGINELLGIDITLNAQDNGNE